MKKYPNELEFISRIKRDGSGTEKLTEENLFFFQENEFAKKELYELTPLSMSEKTFIASGFNSYVVKLKPIEPRQPILLPAEYKNVNRIEVINHSGVGRNGREYVKYNISIDEFSLQDDGKTLKIFLK